VAQSRPTLDRWIEVHVRGDQEVGLHATYDELTDGRDGRIPCEFVHPDPDQECLIRRVSTEGLTVGRDPAAWRLGAKTLRVGKPRRYELGVGYLDLDGNVDDTFHSSDAVVPASAVHLWIDDASGLPMIANISATATIELFAADAPVVALGETTIDRGADLLPCAASLRTEHVRAEIVIGDAQTPIWIVLGPGFFDSDPDPGAPVVRALGPKGTNVPSAAITADSQRAAADGLLAVQERIQILQGVLKGSFTPEKERIRNVQLPKLKEEEARLRTELRSSKEAREAACLIRLLDYRELIEEFLKQPQVSANLELTVREANETPPPRGMNWLRDPIAVLWRDLDDDPDRVPNYLPRIIQIGQSGRMRETGTPHDPTIPFQRLIYGAAATRDGGVGPRGRSHGRLRREAARAGIGRNELRAFLGLPPATTGAPYGAGVAEA
jgi:hypothetical protein